jgi:hypothetical protein
MTSTRVQSKNKVLDQKMLADVASACNNSLASACNNSLSPPISSDYRWSSAMIFFLGRVSVHIAR